jgi:hypothetical protein
MHKYESWSVNRIVRTTEVNCGSCQGNVAKDDKWLCSRRRSNSHGLSVEGRRLVGDGGRTGAMGQGKNSKRTEVGQKESFVTAV